MSFSAVIAGCVAEATTHPVAHRRLCPFGDRFRANRSSPPSLELARKSASAQGVRYGLPWADGLSFCDSGRARPGRHVHPGARRCFAEHAVQNER